MDNLILIGMPGCGKSTVGVLLAKALGYDFLSSDIMIQVHEGKLIGDIIESLGNWGFNKVEDDLNAELDVEKTVVATGGSVIYGEKAMRHMDKIGTIVYLWRNEQELSDRFDAYEKQNISAKSGQTFGDIYEERTPLYEKYADLTVDISGLDNRESANKVIAALKERGTL